jgi:hypothetical protein
MLRAEVILARSISQRAINAERESTMWISSKLRATGGFRTTPPWSRSSGEYLRGWGLVSDVAVIDKFPARYGAAVVRQHRWVRGEWQFLPWILGRGWTSNKDRRQRVIPVVGRCPSTTVVRSSGHKHQDEGLILLPRQKSLSRR